jgi:predicted nucleotidyltransferase
MKEKVHDKLQHGDKSALIEKLKSVLEERQEILFAFVHGSFIKDGPFRDIDIAVYLSEDRTSVLEYELELETVFVQSISRYPVDIRVLNNAPLSFKYNVIKEGRILVVKNDDARTDFQEITLTNYFDFAPFRSLYLKETLGIGA